MLLKSQRHFIPHPSLLPRELPSQGWRGCLAIPGSQNLPRLSYLGKLDSTV